MENNLRSSTPWKTVGGRVISLVSRKGGVGKTTSAVNLGAALALSGHTVLVVGTDPQCGVCRTLGCPAEELPTCLSHIFDPGTSLTNLAQTSSLKGLFFVSPKILTLHEEDKFLDFMDRKRDIFVREIDRARNFYDTILIDCPPSLGPPTRASLMASDSYLVPVQAEELCRSSLGYLIDFVETFRVCNELPTTNDAGITCSEPLSLDGLFLTMANHRTIAGKHVANKVSAEYPGLLFETSIPRNTRLSEMALKGKPSVIFDRRSSGSRAYFDLADELVNRYQLSHEAEEFEMASCLVEGCSQPQKTVIPTPERIGVMANLLGGLSHFLTEIGEKTQATLSTSPKAKIKGSEADSTDRLLTENESHFPEKSEEGWDDGYRPYGSSEDDCLK